MRLYNAAMIEASNNINDTDMQDDNEAFLIPSEKVKLAFHFPEVEILFLKSRHIFQRQYWIIM